MGCSFRNVWHTILPSMYRINFHRWLYSRIYEVGRLNRQDVLGVILICAVITFLLAGVLLLPRPYNLFYAIAYVATILGVAGYLAYAGY